MNKYGFDEFVQYKDVGGIHDIPIDELLEVDENAHLAGVLDALSRGYKSLEKMPLMTTKQRDAVAASLKMEIVANTPLELITEVQEKLLKAAELQTRSK
jgi:hypothetical protein